MKKKNVILLKICGLFLLLPVLMLVLVVGINTGLWKDTPQSGNNNSGSNNNNSIVVSPTSAETYDTPDIGAVSTASPSENPNNNLSKASDNNDYIKQLFYQIDIISGGKYWYNDAGYSQGDFEISTAINSINIGWIFGDITVTYSENDKLKVSEKINTSETGDYRLGWKIAGNNLDIKYLGSGVTIPEENLSKNLTIEVPLSMASKIKILDIETGMGAVQICGITADEIEIETASGNIECKDVTAKKLSIDDSSTHINSNNSEIVLNKVDIGELECDTASEVVQLTGKITNLSFETDSGILIASLSNAPSELEIDTNSGSADIALPSDIKGFTVECERDGYVSDAVIKSDFDVTYKDDTVKYGSGSGTKIEFDSLSGTLTIAKNTNK